MVKEAMDLKYVTCAGVDVPRNWTLEHLKASLANRRIKLPNDKDVVDVFGEYVELKRGLFNSLVELEADIRKAKKRIKKITCCPHCNKEIKEPKL